VSETFEPGGVIMETREDGYPVIYSLLNHLPYPTSVFRGLN
jgi:hypothetical protein